MGRAGRKWLRRTSAAVLILLLVCFIAFRLIGSIFRAKLAAAVSKELHVELLTGPVIYLPPFTLIARDVRFVRHESDGSSHEMLHASGMDLTLSGLPKKGGPMPLRYVVLHHPAFRWREGEAPLPLDRLQLNFHPQGPTALTWDLAAWNYTLVELYANGTLDTGTGVCQVRSLSAETHFANLSTRLPWPEKIQKQLDALAPAGKLALTGSGTLPLKNARHASYHLTADLSDISVRLERWKHSLDGGTGRLLINNGSSPAAAADSDSIEATLDHFEIAAGTARLRLGGGKFTTFVPDKTWKLAGLVGTAEMGKEIPISLERTGWFFEQAQFKGPIEFTAAAGGPFRIPPGKSPMEVFGQEVLAYPHGLSLKPSNFSAPIDHITGGPISCRGGVVSLQNLSGTCGQDQILLSRARLTLWDPIRKLKLDDLRKQIRFEEINGTVLFHSPSPRYPSALGKTVSVLRPTGPFVVGGGSWYAINRDNGQKLKPDFFISLITEGGSFVVTPWNVPLTQIHGQATITPIAVKVAHFDCQVQGGTGWAAGTISPGKPFLYDGRVEIRDIDLQKLAALLNLQEPARSRLSGQGYGTAHVTGTGPGGPKSPAQAVVSDGEVQILRGDFWSVPPVGVVATQVKRQEELGVGDAAAVFHVADKTITLQNAAVNAPLIGLQGNGTVGFDGSIFLTIVVAPLGDWRDRMKQANIPVVGDILGTIQQLFNTVQGVLLYQFRVTGTITHPIKDVIPAPVITDPLALLFGQMLQPDRNGQLLNDVKA
ncbi:MAG TPA: hypothetical protein VLJ39_05425, partial [Tepidisphaeraceae bacterium]|nr:hypothetical protein [Tepidisphaeraceae bacterium]